MNTLMRRLTLVGVVVALREVATTFLRGWVLNVALIVLTVALIAGRVYIKRHAAAVAIIAKT